MMHKELASICHDHGVPLLVDEAHGGHFGLHPAFPPSALQQGADLSVQSTHKVLSAMTQAAMLHIRGTRVDQARVSRALQMLQVSHWFDGSWVSGFLTAYHPSGIAQPK